ncbi:type III-B CRISPR module RAMP protein Cmr6 [Clostridium botulinum]|nr:type III-B CRISPR module RAMP protein Cmr6 [Clostridium botulinum]
MVKTIDLDKIYQLEHIGEDKLLFNTTYPGLLVGSGLIHSIGEKGENKLGFEFDYTTGLPIIRGSSVKGLLRSVFDLLDDKEKKNAVVEYLKDIILNNTEFDDKHKDEQLNVDYFKNLKEEIFEGISGDNKLPIYERDIFYESVIDFKETKKEHSGNKKIQILGQDYITPHKTPLKNPIPIKFIKLMPNIVLRFQFDLKDGILKKEEKLALFKQILLDFGIGAKTNVGYGRLEFISY